MGRRTREKKNQNMLSECNTGENKDGEKECARYELRERMDIDWSVYFDTTYDKIEARRKPTVPYGLKSYDVRRVIWHRDTMSKREYLVEWEKFDLTECTWEPMGNMPKHMEQFYRYPIVSEEVLVHIGRRFESAVQRRLIRAMKYRTKPIHPFTIDFPLDVFRYVFGENRGVYGVSKNNFYKLPLSKHWYYYIDKGFNRVELNFPIAVEPLLSFRNIREEKDEKIVRMRQPVEKIRITLSFLPIQVKYPQ